jgi:murein DD-endopeptidase MepM/ murein hydrolase activator NlpD
METTPGLLLPPDVRYATTFVSAAPFGQPVPAAGAPAAEMATGPAAPAMADPQAVPEPEPIKYLEHQVAEGETLTGIGAQYGVDSQYLIWNNPEVGADPDMLVPGETLVVPATPGIVYDVKLGDTVTDIATTYGIDPAAIVLFAPNGLDSPDMIVEGSVLVLPGGVPPPPPVEELPAPVVTEVPAPEEPQPVLPPQAPPPAPALPVDEPVAASVGYIWPAAGPLNSRFGPRWGSFHSGIDIGAPYGAAVAASATGRVVLASYSNYGYGNYIIVRHGDGSETLYAHLSASYVSLGQYVGQGETIGAVGCTGWCTGPHLHFEVRISGSSVDPLIYLP